MVFHDGQAIPLFEGLSYREIGYGVGSRSCAGFSVKDANLPFIPCPSASSRSHVGVGENSSFRFSPVCIECRYFSVDPLV